jgi:hypothetical protein
MWCCGAVGFLLTVPLPGLDSQILASTLAEAQVLSARSWDERENLRPVGSVYRGTTVRLSVVPGDDTTHDCPKARAANRVAMMHA